MSGRAFMEAYAFRSGVSVEFLESEGFAVYPCECGEEGCEGWAMLTPGAQESPFDVWLATRVGDAPARESNSRETGE